MGYAGDSLRIIVTQKEYRVVQGLSIFICVTWHCNDCFACRTEVKPVDAADQEFGITGCSLSGCLVS